ncbi:ATP-dependent DNA helicase RecG [Sporohalobacter salinus]|uniref:ATP-dependent DNA helicase RecG n=1 Tax=Sporohalobacter salinus TaxID=1494606 RepID=UPI0019600828|nr:ATP-dependent DNA helicase RecG [Sporohalobacter salinus]MBM7623327.1 ATP-dependent DNA helicase RecG [Sporohalobacter salinus]
MDNKKEILQKLLKPIKIEKKVGYNNSSVFGGFDNYLLQWLNRLEELSSDDETLRIIDDLKELFSDYSQVQAKKRKKKLASGKELFTKLSNVIQGRETESTSKLKSAPENNKVSVQRLPQIWQKSIRYVKGVGKKRAKKLAKLGVDTLRDMLFYIPRDYRDWSKTSSIRDLSPGSEVTITGQVVNSTEIRPRKGLIITKVIISDNTGSLSGVWFNQPYIKKKFKSGEAVAFSGEVKREYGELQISHPHYEIINSDSNYDKGKILPVYSATQDLNQNLLRKIVSRILEEYLSQFPEFLSEGIKEKYSLLEVRKALYKIHFPDRIEEIEEARKRLAFDELFILQLGILLKKTDLFIEEEGLVHSGSDELITNYLADLPFELTSAQKRVWTEIKNDLERSVVMNRLIQGDVGSGKTVVATLALLKAVSSGYQGAMMAPTEILAEQHYLSLKESLEKYGLQIGLLVGSLTKNEKEEIITALESGEVDIVIGTHALIQEEIRFSNLGLVITDEQHRFGVRQRATFKEKGKNPDVLVMTATPIPRTLALTLYGDLDLSVIDELPSGRKPVVTEWRTEKEFSKIFSFVRQEIESGRQAYIVCPLVEESEEMDVRSAENMAEKLEDDIFPEFDVALLHGQLKTDEKEAVMEGFRSQQIDILVSTTVIEVGVDVANATLMIILDAQRFGLAQLHQLRGRVGRSEHQSYCVLVAEPGTDTGRERMKIMTRSTDGFVIAEEDLKLRGPGEFFGTRQHGLPDLEVADLLRDSELVELARKEARVVVENDSKLQKEENQLLGDLLQVKFGENFELIDVS